jgi:hypothetical protein
MAHEVVQGILTPRRDVGVLLQVPLRVEQRAGADQRDVRLVLLGGDRIVVRPDQAQRFLSQAAAGGAQPPKRLGQARGAGLLELGADRLERRALLVERALDVAGLGLGSVERALDVAGLDLGAVQLLPGRVQQVGLAMGLLPGPGQFVLKLGVASANLDRLVRAALGGDRLEGQLGLQLRQVGPGRGQVFQVSLGDADPAGEVVLALDEPRAGLGQLDDMALGFAHAQGQLHLRPVQPLAQLALLGGVGLVVGQPHAQLGDEADIALRLQGQPGQILVGLARPAARLVELAAKLLELRDPLAHLGLLALQLLAALVVALVGGRRGFAGFGGLAFGLLQALGQVDDLLVGFRGRLDRVLQGRDLVLQLVVQRLELAGAPQGFGADIERLADGGHGRGVFRGEPVEPGAAIGGFALPRPVAHDVVGFADPLQQTALVGGADVVAKLGRDKAVDLRRRRLALAGPGHRQAAPDGVDHPAPVLQQLVVGHREPRQAPRRGFALQDIAEPQDFAVAGVQAVAAGQRGGHFRRAAHHGDDARLGAERAERLDPERQQLADPGILQDEQRRVAEFATQHLHGARPQFRGLGRGEPGRIHRLAVAPGRAGRGEHLVVELVDGLGFPVTPLVARLRPLQQRVRQIATHQPERAAQGRRAAAMHPDD